MYRESPRPTKNSTCYLDDVSDGSAQGVQWIDERTKHFAKRWSNHKARNIFIYGWLATRRLPTVKYAIQYFPLCPKVFYSELYDKLFEVPPVCITHACLRHLGESHYLYLEFVYKTFDAVAASKLIPPIPSRDGNIAVLFEPRERPLLESTVKQVMRTVGEDWTCKVVSDKNINYVRQKMNVYDSGSKHILTI